MESAWVPVATATRKAMMYGNVSIKDKRFIITKEDISCSLTIVDNEISRYSLNKAITFIRGMEE